MRRDLGACGRGNKAFTVLHYAGAVVYDADGFLEKNKDLLHQDLYDMLSRSKAATTASLFPAMSKQQRKNYSLGGKFRLQLNKLMKLGENRRTSEVERWLDLCASQRKCVKP